MQYPAIYLASIWKTLPEKVPMHYNLKGEPDRFGNKTELLVMMAYTYRGEYRSVFPACQYFIGSILKDMLRKIKTVSQRMAFAVSVFMSAVIPV